ncbi:large subunit ribosomal protein L29 [Desulfosalsimonas propionicica]|mgnify:CR=1 FL=1|jgi:large subunit ribosomal protein L29|uniref:Large ribosomal subunit protein uL29 n=1 Tax=Desulfosalsimonas propionicica TaxID=332175 RepID=A0A7W0CA20_9BACT|nr:50S ribosomal protein L29 [Desulfosalsimonas propionicica]MBA2881940.1 large subunit ribosomal protein L29 [Desulfosalsimonas propionicica]
MEAKEIRGLGPDELESRLEDLVQTFFNLRFQHKTGQLENPRRINQVRRDIARIKTIKRQQAFTNR